MQSENISDQIYDFLEIQSAYAPSFNAIDDGPILKTVLGKYPEFSIGKEDKILRKIFLDMLADSGFVSWLLDYYSMGIDTFVKVIFRNYGDIFNSAIFLKKVRKIVSEKKYKRSIDF